MDCRLALALCGATPRRPRAESPATPRGRRPRGRMVRKEQAAAIPDVAVHEDRDEVRLTITAPKTRAPSPMLC